MAIVEAASCGLQVVTTRVGGIPEVLPDSLTVLTEPTIESVNAGLMVAINRHRRKRSLKDETLPNGSMVKRKANDSSMNGSSNHNLPSKQPKKKKQSTDEPDKSTNGLCPFECNEIVRNLYNWENVAQRTEHVYQNVLKQSDPPFGEKLRLYGAACASFMVVITAIFWLLRFLDWFHPVNLIDEARDFPRPIFHPKKSTQIN